MLTTIATRTLLVPDWIGQIFSDQDIRLTRRWLLTTAILIAVMMLIIGISNLVTFALYNSHRRSLLSWGLSAILPIMVSGAMMACAFKAYTGENGVSIGVRPQNPPIGMTTEMPEATQHPVYADTTDQQKQIATKQEAIKQTARPKTPEELAAKAERSKLAAISVISVFGIIALVVIVIAACLTALVLAKRLRIKKTCTGKWEVEIMDENTGGSTHE